MFVRSGGGQHGGKLNERVGNCKGRLFAGEWGRMGDKRAAVGGKDGC